MKYVIISGIVILAIFLFVLSKIPIGKEPLTEVYFENHTKLPANIFLNKSYNFSFTVHNLEYRDMKYSYTIDAEYNDTTIPFENGSFILSDNQSITLNESFKMKTNFDRAMVKVLVTKDTNESIDIDFWVDQITSTKIYIEYENSSNSTSSANSTKQLKTLNQSNSSNASA